MKFKFAVSLYPLYCVCVVLPFHSRPYLPRLHCILLCCSCKVSPTVLSLSLQNNCWACANASATNRKYPIGLPVTNTVTQNIFPAANIANITLLKVLNPFQEQNCKNIRTNLSFKTNQDSFSKNYSFIYIFRSFIGQ